MAIPIDQTHEQENAKVKGKGGAIGLTEDPDAFKWWMIPGPEQARIFTNYEREHLGFDDIKFSEDLKHHEEGLSNQVLFQKQVNSLVERIKEYANPFLDDCPEILVLNTRECVCDIAANNV